ncbi:MAG: hypothetical protein Kow00109_10760 [Acidobacteriota bacterium]
MRKACFWLLGILLLAQSPFLYRLYRTWELVRFVSSLEETAAAVNSPFQDLPGVVHVHTAAGGHSLGTYPEVLDAARRLGLRYVFITEHPRRPALFREIEDPEIVVLYGWEVERKDGGRELRTADDSLRIQLLYELTEVPPEVAGVEVFNIAESARPCNGVLGWGTWLYHRIAFPDYFFFHCWRLDAAKLAFWDRGTSRRRLAGYAGNNAHQNVGLILTTAAGQRWIEVLVDPYELSFAFVTNHLQLPPGRAVDREAIVAALREGAAYIAFEQVARPRGFYFAGVAEGKPVPPGAEAPAGSVLLAESPYRVRFRLLWNGQEALVLDGRRMEYVAETPGAYRLEVYFPNAPALLAGRPWILTNPVYVR